MKKFIKAIAPKLWDWMETNPKKVFRYGIIAIVISLVVSLISDVYFPNKNEMLLSMPEFSDKTLQYKQALEKREVEIEKVVTELKTYQKKKNDSFLTREDSLRIEFLNKQYNKLKNGQEQ